MIYCGRAGMWNDWQSFQAKAARNRKDAVKNQAKEKYKRQQAALENLNLAIKVGGILIVIMASAFGVAIYLRTY